MYPLAALVPEAPQFRTSSAASPLLRDACHAQPHLARFDIIGESEAGRPLAGITMGHGPAHVSLIAGNHADEPVGPETLRTLVLGVLAEPEQHGTLLARWTFHIVPHTNPDGEARNQKWIQQWPDIGAFMQYVAREVPGRDLEFGFPDIRAENRALAGFLRKGAPYVLHLSLHGMAFSEGALLLIERQWAGRTERLRAAFRTAARAAGLPLHDHNRMGEKGFFYIEKGFTTTPEGAAMRAHFNAMGQPETAALFGDSSMEFVRSLGGDPLSLVTELPLFVLSPHPEAPCGVPSTYLRFKAALPEMRLDSDARGEWPVAPLNLATAIRLQLTTIALGLDAVDKAL